MRASLACGSQNLVSSNAEKPSFKYSEDFIFMEAFCFFLDQLIQCVISRASVTGEGSAVVHVGSFPRPYHRHPMFRRLVKPGGGIGIRLGKPSLWVSKLIPGGWRLHKEPSVVPQNCDHPLSPALLSCDFLCPQTFQAPHFSFGDACLHFSLKLDVKILNDKDRYILIAAFPTLGCFQV